MTKKTNAAPTMKDVAAEAGVALGTVSKVFNHIPVGEAYRLRVEEAAPCAIPFLPVCPTPSSAP